MSPSWWSRLSQLSLQREVIYSENVMGPWGAINMTTFRELEKTGDIVTIRRLKMFRPCQHWVNSLRGNSKANGSHWIGAQLNWMNWDQTRGHSVWLPSTASLMDDKQLLRICPLFLIETLPHPDAHTGHNSESTPALSHTLATNLMWLLSTGNVASATEVLALKFHLILSSSNLHLKPDTWFHFENF